MAPDSSISTKAWVKCVYVCLCICVCVWLWYTETFACTNSLVYQRNSTFLKIDLTSSLFWFWCVSVLLGANIREHLLQSFLFLPEEGFLSVAGLLYGLFSFVFPEEGSIVLQTPLPQYSELWPGMWGLQVQRYWSCGACHWELRAITAVRNGKGFVATVDVCLPRKYTTKTLLMSIWWNTEQPFMGYIFSINCMQYVNICLFKIQMFTF